MSDLALNGRTGASSLAEIRSLVVGRLDSSAITRMEPEELAQTIDRMVAAIADERRMPLNKAEQSRITMAIVDDIVGLGPLEPLVRDPTVNDILINGPDQVYLERYGKLELSSVRFRNAEHLLHIAQRIAATVGRRVDESSPMLDARLRDGSRVNILLPPLALRGPYVSIRKFMRDIAALPTLVEKGAMTRAMAEGLRVASAARLNIVISGGTGAGKTTLLNAMSQWISPGERVITIEDVAELQLRQPHVLSMETRQANIEGKGEVLARDLVRNALRMRPDRIIVGEVRGGEAFDMMQAMNTGHNGSMTTVHANTPGDAIHRIENMVLMAETSLPVRAIRSQIASAVDLIVQVERMRDGVRRVTGIHQTEGLVGDEIRTSPLWEFVYTGERSDGIIRSSFRSCAERPFFAERLQYFKLIEPFLEALREDAGELRA